VLTDTSVPVHRTVNPAEPLGRYPWIYAAQQRTKYQRGLGALSTSNFDVGTRTEGRLSAPDISRYDHES
jgi:hypothetical protein